MGTWNLGTLPPRRVSRFRSIDAFPGAGSGTRIRFGAGGTL